VTGVVLCSITFLNHRGLLPVDLPRTWVIHRFAWYAFGLLAFFSGCYFMRSPHQEDEFDNEDDYEIEDDYEEGYHTAKHSQSKFQSLVLYTRTGCHLCDDVKVLLLKYQSELPPVTEVDIDNDAALLEKFNNCVPVLELDGKIRFRGKIDEALLRRLLDN